MTALIPSNEAEEITPQPTKTHLLALMEADEERHTRFGSLACLPPEIREQVCAR